MIDEASIGKRIKAQRRASGLTLQDVADATGLTKGYLSKVETSGKAAPVPTLARIAKALNVALADLFGDVEKDERVSLVRADQREQLARGIREFGYSYELLCVGMNNQYMEPYVLTIPRDTVCIPSQHDGEELVFVIEGTMVFHHGDHEYVLEKGDSLYFDSGVPHFGEARGDREAKCVMVAYSESGSLTGRIGNQNGSK